MAVQYIASNDPTLCGSMLKHEGRRQTDRRSAYAGSRLKLIDASGRSRVIRQPFSRNGENSPYGMLGGIVETSASFEARSAPRSYPTIAELAVARVGGRLLGWSCRHCGTRATRGNLCPDCRGGNYPRTAAKHFLFP